MFINFSNHPVEKWSDEQKAAALAYGPLKEIPFPHVPAEASAEKIQRLADESSKQIAELNPSVVMCQGEFTLTYAIVSRLKAMGITCISACSNRESVERLLPNGTVVKEAIFRFVQFREYS